MRTRTLGPLEVSVIGLGCNNFGMTIDQAQSMAVLGFALDSGITHLDTAEIYGKGQSESFIGAALGKCRDATVIATKFAPRPSDEPYEPGALRRRIIEGCEGSLRRLRTDRIDLYYQHYVDPAAPPEEALATLGELQAQGKVLAVASSNVTAKDIEESDDVAAASSLPRFCGTQIEWNLLNRAVEAEIVPAALSRGLGIIPYFPLASGMLTGKYRRGAAVPKNSRLAALPAIVEKFMTDANHDRVAALEVFAADHGHTVGELAIAWLAAQDGVGSVIAGATDPEQIRSNVAAAEWALSPDKLADVPV